MTERQHTDDFLNELLTTPESTDELSGRPELRPEMFTDHHPLSHREERKLLSEARAVGPVTLSGAAQQQEAGGISFVEDVTGFIRAHPVPAALTALGVGFLLMQRGKRRR
jgi:hypothetical protein